MGKRKRSARNRTVSAPSIGIVPPDATPEPSGAPAGTVVLHEVERAPTLGSHLSINAGAPTGEFRDQSEVMTRMAVIESTAKAWRPLGWVVAAVLLFLVAWLIRPILTTFLLALGTAYLLSPLVERMEKKRVPRGLSILGLLVSGAALLTGLAFVLIPLLVRDVGALVQHLPGYWASLLAFYGASVRPWVLAHFGIALPATQQDFLSESASRLSAAVPDLAGAAAGLLKKTVSDVFHLVGLLFNLLLFPIFLFYLLRDFPLLRKAVIEAVPPRARPGFEQKLGEVNRVLAAFLHGQLIVCAYLATMYSIGLSLTGIDLPVLIGIAAGLLFVIPYGGFVFGITVGSAMAIAKFGLIDPQFALRINPHLLGVWATFALVQFSEAYFVTPRIVGEKVGLHPVVMLTAVIVGGEVFGFLGILLAVPVTATAAVFWWALWDRYKESGFYRARA